MLHYLSHGSRPFGDYPMAPHKRVNWEFYGVVGGRVAPWFPGEEQTPVADTLWLFPPGCEHGWLGEPQRPCEVVVFHFSAVPTELERRARKFGYAVVSLGETDRQRLCRLVEELEPHYWNPTVLSEYYFERALLDLSLLVLEKPEPAALVPTTTQLPRSSRGTRRGLSTPAIAQVLAAENWFRHHLGEQPRLGDVARANGLSPAHLRRLFWSVRRCSPKTALNKLRMEHSLPLLAHSDLKIEAIAADCGFAGASQFCQAFKSYHGTTPTAWRSIIYSQYDPTVAPPGASEVLVRFNPLTGDGKQATGG